MITKFQQRVYDTSRKIPRGNVSTYAQIARIIGKPQAARAVGNALNINPYLPRERSRDAFVVPCHRVIRSNLTVGGYALGKAAKIKILKKEGVEIKNGKVAPKHILSP